MPELHFWTLREKAQMPWEPDAEPDLHLTAYGHAFLELYWRLHKQQAPVTIGPKVPRDCRTVVVSLEELTQWDVGLRPRVVGRLAAAMLPSPNVPAVAVLRVDTPLHISAPRFATLELMPTRASVQNPGQVWVPMLPQRGLLRRDAARGARMETVALKAFSFNVPDWMDADFAKQASALGFNLRVDTETTGRWRDFAEVDVALCVHDLTLLGDERRKPATKLVNAWRAGAIPICSSHTAYEEVGLPDVNMLVANTPSETLAALSRLRSSPSLVGHLHCQIDKVAGLYEPERVAREHYEHLVRATRSGRRNVVAELGRAVVGGVAGRLSHQLRANT